MFLTLERAKANLSIAARILCCALVALVLMHPTDSRADVWEWLTDLVQEDSDVENASLSGTLPPDAVVTGRGETRTIQLGRDLIELHPTTAITIEVGGEKTTVHLLRGTIRAKVAKRKKSQLFEVETANLVGTVKGTQFEVSVMGAASAVSVYEGRVAVKAVGTIGGVDVIPGRTATVTSTDREPTLGKTPTGGAAAAAKARAGGSTSAQPADNDDTEPTGNRDVGKSGRSSSGSNAGSGGSGGSRGGSDSGGGSGGSSGSDSGGSDGSSGTGSNDSDGEGSESGEGGEGGDDGDDGDDD
jgi:hypothetical protein